MFIPPRHLPLECSKDELYSCKSALLLFQGRLINEQKIPFERHSIFRSRQNFVLPRSFISNSLFKQFVVVVNSSKVNMCLAVSLFLKKKKKLSNILHESICYFVA